MSKPTPSVDAWLTEAKELEAAGDIGMYLLHNGVVRQTPRALVREGDASAASVTGMTFSYDEEKVLDAIDAAYALPGIGHIHLWLNEGELAVGDDIMYVLIGGDIRPHVIDALSFLVEKIKTECVQETEHHA